MHLNTKTDMKTIISPILIASILFVVIFGLTALEHSMSHQQSNCVVSVMSNAPCPTNIKSIVEHHVSVIRSFFNVTVSTFVISIILLIAVSLISFAYLFRYLLLHNQFITQRSREHRHGFNLAKYRFIAWLSLFEYSPSS